jgi:hypothetical protein
MVPIWKFISIGVTVIQKLPFLTNDATSLFIGLTLVNTRWMMTKKFFMNSYGSIDVCPLGDWVHSLVVNPTISERIAVTTY